MMRYIRLVRNISNWGVYFSVKMGLAKEEPLRFKARNNIQVEVPRRLFHGFKEIFMEECYTRGFAFSMPENPVVIDIGANAGYFSLFAASRFPGARIYSYEPVGANYDQLSRNRDLNPGARISCFQKAVYGYTGQTTIRIDTAHSFTTSATVTDRAGNGWTAVSVPCIALQDIFDVNDLSGCDFLKMDCEGAEFDILYNCPDEYIQRIDRMALEVHGGDKAGENMTSLIDWLCLRKFNTRSSGYMLWAWR